MTGPGRVGIQSMYVHHHSRNSGAGDDTTRPTSAGICRQPSDPTAPTCPRCGAPIDVRAAVSDSGWVRAAADQGHGPDPVRPVARARSRAPTVPVAEFAWRRRTGSTSRHHVLLWTDPPTRLSNMSDARRLEPRAWPGMPLIMVEARGPGHIALSDNHAGEVIALPLQHGQPMWVREHRFLCATGNIALRLGTSPTSGTRPARGDDRETHYPMGQYGDIFTAAGGPGLLLLHSPGNTFIRDLQPGRVAARPAERAALPRPLGADAPAPGVPAEPGLRVLERHAGATATSGCG